MNRIELLKERERLYKEYKKVKRKEWDEINSLEDFSFFNETINYLYSSITEMLDTKYNEIRLVIKNCKKMKIDVSELEKAYSNAIENIEKYKGRKMYRRLQDCFEFGDNEDEEIKICELHDKVVQAFIKLEDRYNLDDVEKLEKEIEHYYDQKENVLKSEIAENDKLLEPYEDEYLRNMASIALEKIRKKIKFKKKYFYSIFRGASCRWDREGELTYNTLGDYSNKKKEIRISKRYLEENKLTYKNNSVVQKEFNNDILNTLIHELIHHFVIDEYEGIGKLIDINNDSSPIFMGILLWINGENESNGYECFKEFKETDTYKQMMKCETYDELQTLCIHLTLQTNRIIEKSYETKNRWITPEPTCFKHNEESFYFKKMAEEVLTGKDLERFNNMGVRDFSIGIDWINLKPNQLPIQ